MIRYEVIEAPTGDQLAAALVHRRQVIMARQYHSAFEVIGYSIRGHGLIRYTALVTWRVTNQGL